MNPNKTVVRSIQASSLALAALMAVAAALADIAAPGSFELSWNTIDGGGGTSIDGAFEISGTIGQPDVGGPLTGGTFQIIGGFWPGANPSVNPCSGDISPPGGDGIVNAADLLMVINNWGQCPLPCPPSCNSDLNHDCMTNAGDLLAVINAWGACPP